MCEGSWWEYVILFLFVTPLLALLWYAVLFLWVFQFWSHLADDPPTTTSSQDQPGRRAGRPGPSAR